MTHVDLSNLRLAPSAAPPPAPWQRHLPALGVGLLALAVAVSFAWPWLRPVRAVPMAAVERADTAVAAATVAMAEAAGWIEPDPFPAVVRPLVAGRVESLDVVEGATVVGGQTVIARLGSAVLQAARDRAASALAERTAAAAAARIAHERATAALAQAAALRSAVVEAQGAVADADAKVVRAEGAHQRLVAEIAAVEAAAEAQRRLHAEGGAHAIALARAEAAVAAARAAATAAAAEAEAERRAAAAMRQRLVLAEEFAAAPVDLQTAVATAAAAAAVAEAAVQSAQTELTIAERELQWTTVRAPCDGVVLRLLTTPGAATGPDGDGLVLLYDPRRLRARIDVPLASVGTIAPGQRVELRSEVTGDTVVLGIVDRTQSESDLLKNTLQVKVRLPEPDPRLRPETLCRARFLAAPDAAGAAGAAAARPVFVVPAAALQGDSVFVFDPSSETARAVPVQIQGRSDDRRFVTGDLSTTQRVVLVPVAAGERLREASR